MGLERLDRITAFGEDLMESSESVPSVLHLPAKAKPHSQSSPELGQSHTAELRLAALRLSRDQRPGAPEEAEPWGQDPGFGPSEAPEGFPSERLDRSGTEGAGKGRSREAAGCAEACASSGAAPAGTRAEPPLGPGGSVGASERGTWGGAAEAAVGEETVLERRKGEPAQTLDEPSLFVRLPAPEAFSVPRPGGIGKGF